MAVHSTLMNQLVEGVLTIGARFAPDHRSGRVIHAFPAASHVLSVGLHVALLEVGGKPVQVLIVRQQGVGLRAEKVAVPDAQQSQNHRSLEKHPVTFQIAKNRK